MTGLHITYGPNDRVALSGTEEQIKRLVTLAAEGVHANKNCQSPFLRELHQQELDDLRAIHREWFPS